MQTGFVPTNTVNGQRLAERETPVRFYHKAWENKFESKKQGRPIFDDQLWIDIYHMGSSDITERPMREEDKQKYPLQWEAFEREGNTPIIGVPLEEWPGSGLSVSRIAELKANNIQTIEDLAAFPDGSLEKLGMGGRELQSRAKTFLKLQDQAEPLEALSRENEELKAQLEEVREQIKQLSQQPTKRPRGRPKKEGASQCLEDQA